MKVTLEISYKDENGSDHPGKATLEIEAKGDRHLLTNDMTVDDIGYDFFEQGAGICTKFIEGMAFAFKLMGADYTEVGRRK